MKTNNNNTWLEIGKRSVIFLIKVIIGFLVLDFLYDHDELAWMITIVGVSIGGFIIIKELKLIRKLLEDK